MKELFNFVVESSVSSQIPINIPSSIVAAFAGGFFAAFWSNRYESRRRMNELRMDKYTKHRNTVVQLEHELIPQRVSMSRNLVSLNTSKNDTNGTRYRILLRLYKLSLSPGLSLKLLDKDLINNYADFYSLIESINLDIIYHESLSSRILNDAKEDNINESLIVMYTTLINNLHKNCLNADSKSEQLLTKCQSIIDIDDEKIKANYIKNGGNIIYSIPEKLMQEKKINLAKQEDLEIIKTKYNLWLHIWIWLNQLNSGCVCHFFII